MNKIKQETIVEYYKTSRVEREGSFENFTHRRHSSGKIKVCKVCYVWGCKNRCRSLMEPVKFQLQRRNIVCMVYNIDPK